MGRHLSELRFSERSKQPCFMLSYPYGQTHMTAPPHQQWYSHLVCTASPAGIISCQPPHFPPSCIGLQTRPPLCPWPSSPPEMSTSPGYTPTQPAGSNASLSEGFLQISHSLLSAPTMLGTNRYCSITCLLISIPKPLSQPFHGKQTPRHTKPCIC